MPTDKQLERWRRRDELADSVERRSPRLRPIAAVIRPINISRWASKAGATF